MISKSPKGGYSPFYFKKPLGSGDVEISDDVYLVKAEDAEKHIKPPELARIIITPSHAHLQPGKKQTFTAKGLDQFGRDFEMGKVEWAATGGEIPKTGVFEAGIGEGNFLVTAKSGKVSGEATVSIGKEEEEPKPLPLPEKMGRLTWSGEVPAQKWMNFYTKVLTRFVKGGDLKINVSFEASPKDGISDQQVEETKASLRELGLKDEMS